MRIGVLTRNEDGWCSVQLRRAIRKKKIRPIIFNFPSLIARVKYLPKISINKNDAVKGLKSIIVRPIGRGSLEETVFRLDVLHRLERLGVLIINPPTSIERSVDKYHALAILEENGLPVPRTAVTENPNMALKAFYELGEDVVMKPLFGSRGIGSARISDPDIAERVFKAVSFSQGVLYLQEFVSHGLSDIRAFVVNKRVVASMRRVAKTWKTNVSKGAKPVSITLSEEYERLAVEAAQIIGCKVCGVDILEGPEGPMIIELNSQPGWRGLQSVTDIDISDEIVEYILYALDKKPNLSLNSRPQ